MELPIAHEKVGKNAINKCSWNGEGSSILTGDSTGAISMYILAEKYRKMDGSKYDDLVRYLAEKPETE